MCFSFESSIISYVLGVTASILLLQTNDNAKKHIALFALTFVHMQLAEALMWSDVECKNKLNHYGSIFAHFNLILQPLSILIGAYYFNTTVIPKSYLQVLIFIYFIPLLMAIHYVVIIKVNLYGILIWIEMVLYGIYTPFFILVLCFYYGFF